MRIPYRILYRYLFRFRYLFRYLHLFRFRYLFHPAPIPAQAQARPYNPDPCDRATSRGRRYGTTPSV